ncbi:MAG: alkaline phosphatase family protein [Alphaproteobacteria bacterium]|nr:alkaline phosphatase family protein [Alphaproteobacteria bacterium]
MSDRLKILFIIIDQLRADCILGPLAEHVKTPAMDALRAEATTFTRHFSVTNPCGPSRASIFTGLYAMNHRSVRNGTPLPGELTNVAREARKAGYAPLLFGYTDTTIDPRTRHPADPELYHEEMVLPGFDEIVEMRFHSAIRWRADLKAKGYDLPPQSRFFEPVSPIKDQLARPDDPPFYSQQDSDTAFLTNEFLREMSVRADQNWFALLTYIRPHAPLVAPAPYNRMYQGEDLPLPNRRATAEEDAALHPYLQEVRQYNPIQSLVQGCQDQLDHTSDADVQMMRALYFGLVTEVDHHIGRVVNFLKDSGQYDDTLIVVMADHGEMLGDHHLWGKHSFHDPSFHTPLVIRDPRHKSAHGSTVDALAESIDIAPTILESIGRPIPAAMNGRSLVQFLRGDRPENWRDCVHLELDFGDPARPTQWQGNTSIPLREANLVILREERFKLVHFNGPLPPVLFDLDADPHEMNDLANDPAHATTLLRLTRKLLSFRMTHADHTLTDVKIGPEGAQFFQA